MANTEVVTLIVETTAEFFTYMIPIIAVMSGIIFIVSFLYDVTINSSRKIFRG